ncbi:MAG TPA: HD-GYP domain-containing protein [Solirubrobacter sp.]|nr:HD-GYP domain-containing protein [Solirubrobacter sp.]
MSSSPVLPIDASAERLIEATYSRRPQALPARERTTETALAFLLLAAGAALALLATPARAFSLPLTLAFVAAYVLVHRVEFHVGDGNVVPTQLVLVPMLLLLPTPLVPLLVALATVAANSLEALRGRRAADRLLLAFNDAGFALAPAVVLVALGTQTPAWASWPAYLAALGAQFGADAVRETARAAVGAGVPPRVVLGELRLAYGVDALLAPVGLLAAIAAADAPGTALLVLPLVSLLAVFAREREARIARQLELGNAYRGTALLLCDLLEDDDEYTGHHTHDVVELSARVAAQLGVGENLQRETELGAMLHDIGKIHIPDAIINKDGPLNDEEWELMRTHTVEGQKMLDRVGGFLGSVGRVVRASHERFDGGGYPDGLAGEDIPLAARIVAVCDSFNAMTTTRSYRKAMPLADAVAELHRCSGTQFDPQVVDALLELIGDPGWVLQSSSEYASAKNSGSVAKNADSSSSGTLIDTPTT